MSGYVDECLQRFVPSTGQRNIQFSDYREGDVALVYRHLEWDIDDSARVIDDIDFSGPTLGVIFRW
jgi:hypothetical protein